MPEEFTTRDVLEQVDARLNNVEQDIRALRTEMKADFAHLRSELKEEIGGLRTEMRQETGSLRTEMNARFESNTRWMVGMMSASWVTLMASLWLKP